MRRDTRIARLSGRIGRRPARLTAPGLGWVRRVLWGGLGPPHQDAWM